MFITQVLPSYNPFLYTPVSVLSVVLELPCCCSSCPMDRLSFTLETSEPTPPWRRTLSYSAAGCRRSTWTPRKYQSVSSHIYTGSTTDVTEDCGYIAVLSAVLCDLFVWLTYKKTLHSQCGSILAKTCSDFQCMLSYLSSYCSPEYTFPRQQEVINFAASTAFELVTLNPRTLVVCGSYSVGKEKVFLGECVIKSLNIHFPH